MPDPTSRAKAYGQKADECLRLANLTAESIFAAKYRKLAKSYRELQQFEAAHILQMADKPKDA